MDSAPAAAWLGRLRHDLVKRLLWPARDRRDLGGPLRPAELAVALVDDEGAPASAAALFDRLRADAPPSVPAAALDGFRAAVERAAAAAAAGDLDGVLALDRAFDLLTAAARERTP